MSVKPPGKKMRKDANPLPWVLLVVALIAVGIWQASRGSNAPRRNVVEKDQPITITLPPPPPPPPPKIEPPKEEPPPDKNEEIVEEKPVDLTPPEDPPEKAPSSDLGTNIAGNGPDMGLTRGGGNGQIGGRRGGPGGTNKYARYSLSAKDTIESALRRDPATRSAVVNGLKLEFWPDSSGCITRARIIGAATGSALDEAVKRVLTGLQTQPAANPAEMPPSVKIRITARKPNT